MPMRTRRLGSAGPEVSAIGLGCMSLSGYYDEADEAESERVLHRAIDLGVTFFDTSDWYGHGHNEELVGRVLRPHFDDVVIATKFGIVGPGKADGRPEYARSCCEASLKRLGTDHIDLFYVHRVDPTIPIEETVGALADLVAEGKVLHIGLSEASAATLRRAHAVHPVAAIQSEWSLWTRDLEAEVAPVARELGIAIVPYSPLGRGFLAGSVTSDTPLREGDFRATLPRFSVENREANATLAARLREMAAAAGCSPAQLALAWVLAQGEDVIPIPGTRKVRYLEDNAAAADVRLSPAVLAELQDAFPPFVASGARYAHVDGYSDTPPPS